MAAFDTDPLSISISASPAATVDVIPLITGTGTAPVLSAEIPTPDSTGHLPSVAISFEVD